MQRFRIEALEQLADQQVRFAPPSRRLEQLTSAERLIAEIDPAKEYPYQYVCFRLTDYRPDSFPDLLIKGEDLTHDLYLFMAEVSRSLPALPVETMAEPVLTLEEMSERLNVSTKTINRWRQRGLIGVPVLCNGRRHVGFLPSLYEPFLKANQQRVEKSGRFTQLSIDEKEEILRRAKRLARTDGATLTEVSRRIARRLGRSPETVRYTIKNFDREHPDQALYPALTGPLDGQAKTTIFNSYRRGIPVDTLAKRFHRTRTSMYRVINEVRAQRLLDLPLEYIMHPSFDDPSLEGEILGEMPDLEGFEGHQKQVHAPKDAPPELAMLYENPLLTKEQEQHLFRKMNLLKYKAVQLRDGLDPTRARIQELDQIEELVEQASAIKRLLIKCNMRLVYSIAKRHIGPLDNLFELVSDGNISLIRAVEKFDFSRGNKFSTYASWAIMKNFARSIPDEKHHRERNVTGHDDLFEVATDNRSIEQEILAAQEQKVHLVNRLLAYLDPRERQIVRMRHGLDNNSEGMTLEEIGKTQNITKERVRQLYVRGLNKLQSIAKEKRMDHQ
ncbi:RNA polymerase subunit sigma-70 [Planctomycetaceae bacterium SCGC AG-212-D15]|nr:RNA polymerase subunit sigma-70 [Planctomycetaceae bacterium SCGC AG-212-D15]